MLQISKKTETTVRERRGFVKSKENWILFLYKLLYSHREFY